MAAEHVPPVFIKAQLLSAAEDKVYTVFELCSAAEKSTGFNNIEGSQRLENLWRIYPKKTWTVLRGRLVTPSDKIPYIVIDVQGKQETSATRLTNGSFPMSFPNEKILKYEKNIRKNSAKTWTKGLETRMGSCPTGKHTGVIMNVVL